MSRYQEPSFPALFTQNAKELREFDRRLISVLSEWALNLKGLLNRGLTVADNMDAAIVSFNTNAAPDTEDAVAHGLGRVPTYFAVADINKGGVVYRSGTAFTKDTVYLKTTVASAAVKVILF